MKNKLIVIAGPTGVGKSNVALQLAQHFDTAIISADSRQCYIEMSIGTAKPDNEELQKVPHYFINSHTLKEKVSAGKYEQLALSYCNTIFENHNIAIVCGGTGLYIDALCNGIDEMPKVDTEIRALVQKDFDQWGLSYLQDQIQMLDPLYAKQGEMQNPHRLIRALSFYKAHKRSIIEFQQNVPKERSFEIIKLGIELPRDILYRQINERVDKMMVNGLLEEVISLYPLRDEQNLRTVGYQEFYELDNFPNDLSKVGIAIDKVKQHSRNYAKRQLTWFKKDEAMSWFAPDDIDNILLFLKHKL